MIKQRIVFSSPAKRIYDALMNETEHAKFTKAAAAISNRVGGKFSVWDGYATGINVDLVPGKKIVQQWRASDWPKGINSTVIFEFSEGGGKTKLVFTHKGVPREFEKDVAQGWKDFYWKPLKEYLSG